MIVYLPYLIMGVVIALFWLAERRNPDAVTRFEENVIAVLLALITFVSFSQVRRPLRLQQRLERST